MARTQHGNNNAYCQDNEISWINWDKSDKNLLSFVKQLISLRINHPLFQRRSWFEGMKIGNSQKTDLAWFDAHGKVLSGPPVNNLEPKNPDW